MSCARWFERLSAGDPAPDLCDIEIHADNEGLHNFFGMVKGAAKGWDGSEPLRRVET